MNLSKHLPTWLIRQRWLAIWLPIAVAITLMSGLIYAAVQQDIRSSADDPQYQIAQDDAAQLNNGALSKDVVPYLHINLDSSLATYTIVFDNNGKPVASSAKLNGQTPLPPPGVFSDTKRDGERRFTWQPAPGVRSAAVTEAYRNGFVLVGRSLKLIEQREDDLLELTAVGWLVSLCASAVAIIFSQRSWGPVTAHL